MLAIAGEQHACMPCTRQQGACLCRPVTFGCKAGRGSFGGLHDHAAMNAMICEHAYFVLWARTYQHQLCTGVDHATLAIRVNDGDGSVPWRVALATAKPSQFAHILPQSPQAGRTTTS